MGTADIAADARRGLDARVNEPGIDEIWDGEHLVALIIYASYESGGIRFFTDPSFSQQLGYMRRPQGYVIDAHVHNKVHRDVEYTQEVLIVRKGRLRVDLYSRDCQFLTDRILGPGDIILLASGGHGFEVLEEVEMVEIKQGPYTPTDDKTRFKPTRRGARTGGDGSQ